MVSAVEVNWSVPSPDVAGTNDTACPMLLLTGTCVAGDLRRWCTSLYSATVMPGMLEAIACCSASGRSQIAVCITPRPTVTATQTSDRTHRLPPQDAEAACGIGGYLLIRVVLSISSAIGLVAGVVPGHMQDGVPSGLVQ